jgi:hypothetical protein
MATSWHIVVVLVALAVFGVGYTILDDAVAGQIQPAVDDQADSQAAQTADARITELWGLLPVFATLAGVLYLLKQAVFGRQGVR